MKNTASVGKNSRGMADEWQTREIKQASSFYADPWSLRGWHRSQITSLISETFKGKLVLCWGDEGGSIQPSLFCAD